MDDKERAKTLLQYGDNVISVNELPKGHVVNINMSRSEFMPTFEEMYFMSNEEREENKYIEFDINIKVGGRAKELAYLHNMKNCVIVPYPKE